MECPICSERYSRKSVRAKKLSCCHTLCSKCIKATSEKNSVSCPLCFKKTEKVDEIDDCKTIDRILLSKENPSISLTNPSISLENPNLNTISILVRNLNNRSFELTIKTSDTILQLKQMIDNVENISPSAQWLLYNGLALQDACFVKDYHISNDSIITVVHRSFGG